ncbi:hypothetical protein BDN67DRAFT_985364 [Paxillus ammoniavirescens]|nr:hypothetical protein BDN67DRAFT_985364 [Paxillus ammoniavirescens]
MSSNKDTKLQGSEVDEFATSSSSNELHLNTAGQASVGCHHDGRDVCTMANTYNHCLLVWANIYGPSPLLWANTYTRSLLLVVCPVTSHILVHESPTPSTAVRLGS